jgi:hypothetical protein
MDKGRFYCDDEGRPRAEFSAPNEVVGWFLEQDVQSPMSCDQLLLRISKLAEDPREEFEQTGNAHTVRLTHRTAIIESNYAEPRTWATVSVEELRDAILRWKELLSVVPPRCF